MRPSAVEGERTGLWICGAACLGTIWTDLMQPKPAARSKKVAACKRTVYSSCRKCSMTGVAEKNGPANARHSSNASVFVTPRGSIEIGAGRRVPI